MGEAVKAGGKAGGLRPCWLVLGEPADLAPGWATAVMRAVGQCGAPGDTGRASSLEPGNLMNWPAAGAEGTQLSR